MYFPQASLFQTVRNGRKYKVPGSKREISEIRIGKFNFLSQFLEMIFLFKNMPYLESLLNYLSFII